MRMPVCSVAKYSRAGDRTVVYGYTSRECSSSTPYHYSVAHDGVTCKALTVSPIGEFRRDRRHRLLVDLPSIRAEPLTCVAAHSRTPRRFPTALTSHKPLRPLGDRHSGPDAGAVRHSA